VEVRPVVVDRILLQRRRISGRAFVEDRGPVAARDAERLLLDGCAMPSPNAGSARPPESASSVAHDLATRAGERPGRTCTLVPSLMCLVRAAANVRRASDRVRGR